MPLRRILLLAAAALALTAPAASADITVSNVSAKPADTKAGANTDFTLSFDLGGSENVKDLVVNLPPGLLGNPNNAGKCTQDQFNSDSCPPASKVGTQTANVSIGGLIPADTSGEVFNLIPDKTEPAQLGIRLDTPGGIAPPTHLKSDVTVRPDDSGLTSTIKDIPNNVSGLSIHINSISLTLQAKSGANKAFMTNPTSCNEATTTLHVVGDGTPTPGTADGKSSFTPTACDALKYDPQLSATVGAQGATAARSSTPLTTVITQGPGEANTKATKVTLMSPLIPSVAAVALACPLDAYKSDSCPASSKVGSAEAVTPLLATPLSGPVRIVENPGGLPNVVVYLNGLINQRLVGQITLGANGAETAFNGIPDVPLTRFKLDFDSGSSGLVGTSADLCQQAPKISADFTSHSGKTVTVTTVANVNGCAAGRGGGSNVGGGGGNNGGGGGTTKNAKPIASVALRKLKTKSPILRFKASRRLTTSKKLRSVTVTLPSSLTVVKAKLKKGSKRTPKSARLKRSGRHKLVLTAKKPASSLGATLSRGAIQVSKRLKSRVKKHPKVKVVLRVKDASGKTYKLTKRVTVR